MGFIVSKRPMFGGNSGFVVPDYRMRTVSGYPVQLKKPQELRRITVCGNKGGVGESAGNNVYEIPLTADEKNIMLYTTKKLAGSAELNIFDENDFVISSKYYNSSGRYVSDPGLGENGFREYRIPVKPKMEYSISMDYYAVDPTIEARSPYLRIAQFSASGTMTSRVAYSALSEMQFTFTTDKNASYLIFSNDYNEVRGKIMDVMMVKGSYTPDTMPPYEPYKFLCDTLTIQVKDRTAILNADGIDTDVSSIQDWSQDFAFSGVESATVTADTAVPPSSIEIKYKGKRR